MAYGTLLRVTHSNTINSSIFLSDVHDGKDQNGRVNNRKPPQYVPVDGYVDLIFSEQVTLQAPNDALFLVTRSPVIREINGGANFIVDLGVNNTTGAVQTCVLHWMIIG